MADATQVRDENRSAAYGSAFLAGVLGALAITILLALCRTLGITQMNHEIVLGSLISERIGPGIWLLGFVTHLVMGGLFGVAYAAGFQALRRSGAGTGALFGFGHWLIAGIFMAVLPAIHPLIPGTIGAPGAFALSIGGSAFVLTLVGHLMYGAIVGAIYQQSIRAAELGGTEAIGTFGGPGYSPSRPVATEASEAPVTSDEIEEERRRREAA